MRRETIEEQVRESGSISPSLREMLVEAAVEAWQPRLEGAQRRSSARRDNLWRSRSTKNSRSARPISTSVRGLNRRSPLEEAIRKIDRERAPLRETFDKVNTEFQALFAPVRRRPCLLELTAIIC